MTVAEWSTGAEGKESGRPEGAWLLDLGPKDQETHAGTSGGNFYFWFGFEAKLGGVGSNRFRELGGRETTRGAAPKTRKNENPAAASPRRHSSHQATFLQAEQVCL